MENNKVRIGVIGAGIQGVCSALFLQKKGFQVTLFDRDELRLMSQKEILEFRVELQAGLKELDSYIDKREKTVIFSASEAQPTPSQPSPAPREP